MNGIVYLALLLLSITRVSSQDLVLEWAQQFGASSSGNNRRSMATDPQGNVYSVGLFYTPADFDPGPGVFMMTPQGPFDEAIFISKLDADGNFLWAGQLPLAIEGLIEMEVDKYGNVYVTSRLRDPAVVVKLTADGDFM